MGTDYHMSSARSSWYSLSAKHHGSQQVDRGSDTGPFHCELDNDSMRVCTFKTQDTKLLGFHMV